MHLNDFHLLTLASRSLIDLLQWVGLHALTDHVGADADGVDDADHERVEHGEDDVDGHCEVAVGAHARLEVHLAVLQRQNARVHQAMPVHGPLKKTKRE